MSETRIIALDYGTARIGVAISDSSKSIARTAGIVTAIKRLEKTVDNIIAKIRALELETKSKIEKVVIGLPIKMSGEHGIVADEVKVLGEALELKLSVPVVLWDERLTTVQAERTMREAKMSRKKRSKVIDSVAAVIILQSFLDSTSMS